jgi:hypothetical protein
MQMNNKLSELEILVLPFKVTISTSPASSLRFRMTKKCVRRLISSFSKPLIYRELKGLAIIFHRKLTAFWESQVNSLSRNRRFKNTDLSFGIDSYNQSTESGNQERTSFTYEMEHRFMNNRATVRLSGKLNDYNEGCLSNPTAYSRISFLNMPSIRTIQKT